MRKDRSRPLAYDLRPNGPPIDMRTAAITQCAECPEEGKVIIAGIGNSPERISQLFVRLGWDYDVHNANRCYCPKCVKQRRVRAQSAADVKARESATAVRILKDLTGTLNQRTRVPGLMDSIKLGAGTRKQTTTTEGKVPATIKELSIDQKTALRTAIESYFDAENGHWTNGYNDHTVSEEVGIARQLVAEFRDTFYGPLTDDPEISAFRKNLEEARGFLKNMQSTVDKLELRLVQIEKKVGL